MLSDRTRTKFAGDIPRCSTELEYKAWKRTAKTHSPVRRIGFCQDCTAEFQSENIKVGKCENPGVLFEVDSEGVAFGTLPSLREVGNDGVMGSRKKKGKNDNG